MTVGEEEGENSDSPVIMSSFQQLLNNIITIHQFRNKNYFSHIEIPPSLSPKIVTEYSKVILEEICRHECTRIARNFQEKIRSWKYINEVERELNHQFLRYLTQVLTNLLKFNLSILSKNIIYELKKNFQKRSEIYLRIESDYERVFLELFGYSE